MTSSKKWAVDQPKEGTGKAGPIRNKTDDDKYMLLAYSDDRFVKLIFIDGVPLLPGSRLAVDAGCICDPERNNQGLGRPYDDGIQMVIKDDCPVHPQVDGPVDPDSEGDVPA